MSATHARQTSRVRRIEIQPQLKSTKTKISLAAGLAMLGCVAACTLPVLLAGGLVAGVGALLYRWDVAAIAILVTTATGVVALKVARRPRRR